ncbi:MAG: molecular chaperone HtpG, partial [Gammaproteobacteria bacterium]|nr:molecular chaperone HtpG [Gammaproteobacteria bacterium]
ATEFLPLYLRFVRGVVDSSDLPLNVSREPLQQDDRTRTIKNALTKRVLDMLGKMDAEEYGAVWDEFGLVLKEGVGEDFANKEELLGLMRFASTHNADPAQRTSLADYIARTNGQGEATDSEDETEASVEESDEAGGATKGRDKIYYLIADSDAAARSSPHLEAFRARGVEVLLLTDRIDEWWMSFADEFDGVKFQDVARGELDLGEVDSSESKGDEDESDDEPLLKRIGDVLGDQVESVRRSRRLTDSPACLVLGEHDLGIQMRRIMEATGQAAPDSKPHFEVNLTHPLLERLKDEPDEDRFGDLVSILFDQASLAEGNTVAEPGAYVQRVNKLLVDLMR